MIVKLMNIDLDLGDSSLFSPNIIIGNSSSGHVHFSDPDKGVNDLFEHFKVIPEFLIIGDFPVDTHIISALWINLITHKYDEKLNDSCYDVRLKRIKNDELFDESMDKTFHISSTGSFSPYFQPYQKWRNDGLNTIRDEFENSKERLSFQGLVDAFSSLVESATLDVHAYTIFVNNRKYGNSRVRSPSKQSFQRDLARVSG